MKLFLDTNVLLDVLVQRAPHSISASRIWSRVEARAVEGYISAVSFNNVHYVIRRAAGRPAAHEALKLLRDVFQLIPLDEEILHRAIDSDSADFEDAIQFFSALRARADCLLTRNVRHFPAEPVSVLTPEEFLKMHSIL
jgi:predicted nucleic acid-binding protein